MATLKLSVCHNSLPRIGHQRVGIRGSVSSGWAIGVDGSTKPRRKPQRRSVACERWVAVTAVVMAAVAALVVGPGIRGSGAVAQPRSDDLAVTPPMGWISWGQFHQEIDEALIRQHADALVESGLRDLGYEYVIVDGGWRAPQRDAEGNLQADPERFPSGIKALAEYVHSRGLKLGLHQPVGQTDCRGASPGTQSAPGGSYEAKAQHDAETLAEWDVDYVKFDRCRFAFTEGSVPGAPDVDKITVRRGDQVVLSREAEAPDNVIRGGARVSACERCSGGAMVEAIGIEDGSLVLVNVAVPEAGDYEIDVSFVFVNRGQFDRSYGVEPYAAYVGINRARPEHVRHAATRPVDGTVFHVTTTARLDDGRNTVLISNPSSEEEQLRQAYVAMGQALKSTGHPIVYSLSGASRPWLWARSVGHLARTGFDNVAWWDSGRSGQSTPAAVVNAIDLNAPLARYAGPGYWNDPDMLEVGVNHPDIRGRFLGRLTTEEARSQFSMWAMMAAPLFASADLRTMSRSTRDILGNEEVIAINQDPLGRQATRVRVDAGERVPSPWTASADSIASPQLGPDKVVDWYHDTFWSSADRPMPHWIDLSLRETAEIAKVAVLNRGEYRINDLDVATSRGDEPLTLRASVRDHQAARVVVEFDTPVDADKVRVTVHGETSGDSPRQNVDIAEIEVYDRQGQRIPFSHPRRRPDREVWVKPLANRDRAVALFNRGSRAETIRTTTEEIGMTRAASYVVRDLWQRTEKTTSDEISAIVPPHGVSLFRVAVGAEHGGYR